MNLTKKTIIFIVILAAILIFVIDYIYFDFAWNEDRWNRLQREEGELRKIEAYQDQIGEEFSDTTSNFVVRPSMVEVGKGTKVLAVAGVKNNYPKGEVLIFVTNAKPGDTDAKVTKDKIAKWITQRNDVTSIKPLKHAFRVLSITVPFDAESGSYTFDVYACASETAGNLDQATCDANSDKLWGTPQKITVMVK